MTRSRSAARHEVQQALAEFQRSCERFARGMQQLQPPSADDEAGISAMLGALGPRKPAARARASSGTAETHLQSVDRRAG